MFSSERISNKAWRLAMGRESKGQTARGCWITSLFPPSQNATALPLGGAGTVW